MVTDKIFDRVEQRYKITRFLNSNHNNIIVYGESGVGKSSIIKSCLFNDNQYTIEDVISYSFLENSKKINATNFISFLKTLYKSFRKNKKVKLSSISTGISFIGVPTISASFSSVSQDYEIDEDGIDLLMELLYESGIKVLYISNIELASNIIDINTLEYIKRNKKIKIKTIYEIGTLVESDFNNTFEEWLTNSSIKLKIKNFNKQHSCELYSFINHTKKIPINIFSKTKGNSFHIIHYFDNIKHQSINEIVSAKLSSLSADEMKVVIYLYVLGGESSFNEFKYYLNIDNLEYILQILHESKIILLSGDSFLFYHAFFMQHFNSQNIAISITKAREEIINKFFQKRNQTLKDYLITINQFYELNNYDKIFKYGWIIFKKLYKDQNYVIALNVLELLIESDNHFENKNVKLLIILQLQLLVLIGNGQKARIITEKYENLLEEDKIYPFLNSQILYQENDFPKSNEIINNNMFNIEQNHYLRSIVLGYNISNLIAMGDENTKNSFISAIESTNSFKDDLVYFEIIKFASKMHESWSFGIEFYTNTLKNNNINLYPYTKAKILHNLGLAKLLSSHAQDGIFELRKANEYFEKSESPDIVYNLNALALYNIVIFDYMNAKCILFDSINLCVEQYDKFAIFSNLGSIYLLEKNFKMAEHFYIKAYKVAYDKIYPLKDPSVQYMVNFNLAILYLSNSMWDKNKAIKYLEKIHIPKSMKYYKERVNKLENIKKILSLNKKISVFRNEYNGARDWTVSEFVIVLVKLHFYDFNLKIIQDDKLPDRLTN